MVSEDCLPGDIWSAETGGHLSKPLDSVVKVGVRWPGAAFGFRGLRSHGTGGRDLHNKEFSPLVDGKQPLPLEA